MSLFIGLSILLGCVVLNVVLAFIGTKLVIRFLNRMVSNAEVDVFINKLNK